MAFFVRLALAPALVAVATLAARRWGAAAGGWAAATPVVAGPVLLVLASDHGAAFGAQAAGSATVGLVSLAIFTTVYARAAERGWRWPVCLLAGWAAFIGMTAVLAAFAISTPVALVLALAGFRICRLLLGNAAPVSSTARRLPADIPLRMTAALAMVLALSVVSGLLGARVSGLLAPFPVIGSVMAAFTHVTRGRASLNGYTQALLKGLPSFALFTATVAMTLQPIGTLGAFALASFASACSHALLIYLELHPRAATMVERPSPAG